MQTPSFTGLQQDHAQHPERLSRSFASGVHPNPRFYKYHWWVFWSGSPVDGALFLSEHFSMSAAAAQRLMQELSAKGEPFWVYNSRVPRRDPANPFDPNATRWHGVVWAPPFDQDKDPITPEGYR